MLAQICFPFFDTRFARQEAAGDEGEKPAPSWLYMEPLPSMERIGRFGRVAKWIPPRPYARCVAADLVDVQISDAEDSVRLERQSIEMVADQHGHGRLSISFDCRFPGDDLTLQRIVEQIATADVTVRHPDRHNSYERLGEIGPDLADLYARESTRTARQYTGAYMVNWVEAGRPFLILVNHRRESVRFDSSLLEVGLSHPEFSGRLHFLPWTSSEGDLAFPVWYFEAPRGGNTWRQPAEAIEDVTAHYEEMFVCSKLQERIESDDTASLNLGASLEKHRSRLSGTLRKQSRHGVDLKMALRLLSDYDRSALKPRETSNPESAILARVNQALAEDIRYRMGGQTFGMRRVNVTMNNYTGNVINYGIMTDNTVDITNNMIDQSAAPDDLKAKLRELRQPVLEAAQALPEAEAKALLRDYESFTDTALRENPPKPLVKAQGDQILDTLKKVASYAAPATTIIAAVLKIIGI